MNAGALSSILAAKKKAVVTPGPWRHGCGAENPDFQVPERILANITYQAQG